MNTRRRFPLAIATALCGAAVAAGPAAEALATSAAAASGTSASVVSVQTSWTRVWQASISKEYLQGHGKWVSQGYRLPNGSRVTRGVFSCGGDGRAKLTVWNMDTGKKKTETNWCNGVRRHTPVVGYHNGETIKLILKGNRNITVEAWAGR
ncbi:hypothetical protein [Streptomyces asiaticus]|uniref:hypothetical protein n=1 Tax=Streptomyces asiaticus TaxID=114695 RepID=UPI003F671402